MTAGTSASPVLLTSLASAALLDGRGDLELARESRGSVFDWGGVYGQLVRLTGPWRIFLATPSGRTSLRESKVSAEPFPGGWRSRHHVPPFDVVQEVAAVDPPHGVARSLSISVGGGTPPSLRVVSTFQPYLLPVLVEGIRPDSVRVETSAAGLTVRQRGFGLDYRASVLPSQLYLNRASWIGGHFQGRVDSVASDHALAVTAEQPATIRFLISGGLERDLGPDEAADSVLQDPAAAAERVGAADATWFGSTPNLRFPDDPALERAYDRARRALRRLYTAPGEDLTGLVAGYPWYSAIWCRDLAWMLPALLWLGDFDWTDRALDSVFRFQSRARLPILGGAPGELPMQLSPGPIFLYGTSDTTLYYPDLVARYLHHTGDRRRTAEWAPIVDRALAWARDRADASTGLVRNGGEAEEIEAATQPLGRIRYGIDSPDTTIWDSADRRDFAVDLQVLWRAALLAAADLAEGTAADPRRIELTAMAERVARSVRELYPWEAESYLVDSIREGRPVTRLRPNALRVASAGVVDAAVAKALVRRAQHPDLTTPWGVRTLSSLDPDYRPEAYHHGEVWTIATAWAAEAALAVGETDLGVDYLHTVAARYEADGGWANECYRGDRAEPFDSCFLLGFSVAPFVTTLFERLWGLSVDARVPCLGIRPNFPASWHAASLSDLRVGSARASLDWTPERLEVRWNGTTPLEVRTRLGTTVVSSDAVQVAGNVAAAP